MVDRNQIKRGSFEEKIYKKCDGQNSISAIADMTGKSPEYVGSVVHKLRQKGLIQTIKNNGRVFPKK